MEATKCLILTFLILGALADPNLQQDNEVASGAGRPEATNPRPIELEIPSEMVHTFKESLYRLKDKLEKFGEASSSLALLSFYLDHLKICIDEILEAYEAHCRSEGTLESTDARILIGNKELRELQAESTQVEFDYLISVSLGGGSDHCYALVGTYRIDFHRLGALSVDPDSVISHHTPIDVFNTAKELVLDTPEHCELFC
jgi:hypothetical protein